MILATNEGLTGIIITAIAAILGTLITVLGNRSKNLAKASAEDAGVYAAALEARVALTQAQEDRIKFLEEDKQEKEERITQLEATVSQCLNESTALRDEIAELKREKHEWKAELTKLRQEIRKPQRRKE